MNARELCGFTIGAGNPGRSAACVRNLCECYEKVGVCARGGEAGVWRARGCEIRAGRGATEMGG